MLDRKPIYIAITAAFAVFVSTWYLYHERESYSLRHHLQMDSLRCAKDVSVALVRYSQEQQGLLPFKLGEGLRQNEGLKRHLPGNFTWPLGRDFLINQELLGVSLHDVANPQDTILIFEAEPWWDGRRCVGFVDGHSALMVLEEPRIRRMKRARLRGKAWWRVFGHANGGYVTNVYDVVGRIALVQNQLGENARQFGYDLAGRIVTMADAANRVRSYTFDAAGQNTVTIFPDGKIATFAFDKVGRRTTMVDWGGTSTYSFDALGRQSGQTDAAGFVQSYGYDPNGNRTGLNLVGTGLFTYIFDSLNRLASAQKPGNALYTMAYDADSRRTTMMLGNGTTRKYQFDNRGQLTTQIEFSGATPLCTIVDGYDPVGNRLTRNLDGNPITWSYDDLYRLTGQQKAGQVCTYTLDGVGNLKTMWEGGNFPKTFTFNAADRLVTMVEGASLTTYAWTGYGALESEVTGNSTTGYAYNGQDQLAVVTEPSGDKTTYSFDGDGLRRSVAITNVNQDPPTLDVTTMVWDGSDYLLLNEPTQNRVVLTLDSEIVACGSKDLLTDPLGSLVKEISAGASLGGLVQLTPYGTLLPTSEEPSTPFIYIAAYGYYHDSAERDYVRARELDKRLGRWMQTDPLWPDETAYGYGGSNPSNSVDPSGLQILIPIPLPGTPWWPFPPDPISILPSPLCDWLAPVLPGPDYGIGSCYNGENRNCCTACGLCFSSSQECSNGVAALKGSGYKCGDILICCTPTTCVQVVVTDTGKGRPGRIIDFGCCFAKNNGIMDKPGLVPVTCRKIGHKKIKRQCQKNSDCPGKKGPLC